MKRSTGFLLGGLAASLAFSPAALAQYSITVVDLMPPGAEYSEVRGIWGQHQVGYASFDATNRAVLWSGTADSWVDLHPSGGGSSVGYAIAADQQAGSVRGHAAIWSGSPSSWVDIHPPGAGNKSVIWATSSGQQVGGVGNHAATWTGTPNSFVDLHPTGADQSVAFATTGSQQAGHTYHADLRGYHAALWSGTAASWVDLHPTAASYEGYAPTGSEVSCAVGGLQAGWVYFEYPSFYRTHAGVWSGTADSWLDLNPDGYDSSWIFATTGTIHVGETFTTAEQDGAHATLWLGNARNSILDLNAVVRDTLGDLAAVETYANGVWSDGGVIYVVGNSTAEGIPLLWTLVPVDGSAPAISEIPPQTTLEDTPILDVPFTVSDADTPLDELKFSVLSSNPTRIAPIGVVVKGSGENRTLDITPEPGQHGEALITLTVSDGHRTASTTFQVTVMAQDSVVHVLTGANFSANPGFSVVRNDLLNPALFGPSGTVPHSINLVTTESITADSLEGIEVVILQVTFGPMPTVEDLSALTQFVNAGGGLFVFGNEIDEFASMVGATPSPGWGLGGTATVVDTASPLVTGPFGSLPLGPLFSLCMHDAFASAGPEGLVGITDGGGPFGITYQLGAGRVALVGDEEVFLSSYPGTGACIRLVASSRLIFRNAVAYVIPTGTAGTGPQISEIPPQTTLEDTPILDVPFTVSDPDTPLDELTFSALSSNPTLIAPSGVVVRGTGANRALDITPEPDQFGEVLITLRVSDDTTSASRSFKVTVASVNDGPPVPGPDTLERRAGASVKVAVSRLLANDTDPDLDPLSLTAVAPLSEHQSAVSLSGDWVLYVPPPGLNETDTFTYTVSDGHGGEATGTVTILITDDPAGPSLNQLALNVTRDPDTAEITSLTLTFVGIPGRLYALERAATLELPATWTCLGTQTAGPTGLLEFTDSQPLAGEAYYRTAERTTPCP